MIIFIPDNAQEPQEACFKIAYVTVTHPKGHLYEYQTSHEQLLTRCTTSDNPNIIKFVMQIVADINQKLPDIPAPQLKLAAAQLHAHVVSYLLRHGV